MSESSSISTNAPINRRPIQLPISPVRLGTMSPSAGQYRPIQLPSSVPSVLPKRTPIQLPPSPIPSATPLKQYRPIQLPASQFPPASQYRPIQLPVMSAPTQTIKKESTDWMYYLSVFLIILILILVGFIIWQVFFVYPSEAKIQNKDIQNKLQAQKEEQMRVEKQMLEQKLEQEKKRNEEQEMKLTQEMEEQKKEPEKMNFDIVYDSPKYKDNNNSMKYMMDSDELGNVFLGFWEDLNKRWTAESIHNKEGKYYIKYDDKCLMLNDSNNVALKDYSKEMEDYMTWNLVPLKEELKKNYSNENDLYFIDNNINTPSNVLYNEKTKSYLSVNNSGDIMGVIYPNSDTLLKTE